ncbi:pseudouridine synthase [Thiohalophilus thiocyanatoxydans]|uniref:Pseudouridine synthase n=1 Tax=Thiohalophilus thiocyanatoxydans TaxID=381308 RepID=A0A4V3H4D8_9GAMM|nr:pseudouridine synthase [Thiohalophilus thiocyanatoxydans]TDY02785.1 ribosomal large subunit pseudouridine synthase E [Thiohalophilus thiocyanatoxydans]
MLIGFNKPFGVVCQFSGQTADTTLADYISLPGVYPAGRLDKDSEGLILLTDDGRLQNRISDPAFKLPKIYQVQVEGEPDAAALQQIQQGIELKDGLSAPAEAARIPEPPALWPRQPPVRHRASIPTAWLALTLREGRNRQVRRMTAAVGYPTLRLIRYAIGPWSLDGLQPGQWREIEQPWPSLQQYCESHDISAPPDRRRGHRTKRPLSDGRGRRRGPDRP